MRIVKRDLPEGVRKMFVIKIGKKIKVINKLYCKKPNKTNVQHGQ